MVHAAQQSRSHQQRRTPAVPTAETAATVTIQSCSLHWPIQCARPGGNITGVVALTIELDPKRLVAARAIGHPVARSACKNIKNAPSFDLDVRGLDQLADTLDVGLPVLTKIRQVLHDRHCGD